MAHPDGLFGWADLAVPDTKAGAAFYGRVIGWEVEGSPGTRYSFFTRDGKTAAGMGALSEEQQAQGIPPMWSSYVTVDDVDVKVAKAVELGAEVMMPPMDVMKAGCMAYLFDPTGAAFGLWQAGDHIGADAFNDPGFLSWNELATRDVEGAVAFYTGLFGWGTKVSDTDGFIYTTFTLNGRPNGGVWDMTPHMPDGVPANWSVYFSVDDADEAVATARELGATIVREPTDSPFGRMAVLIDPQGATFHVMELTRIAI